MEAPQTEASVAQDQAQEKKRSPWLVVLIIFLILTMCCCLMGVVLCSGSALLPDILERYLEDIPGFESMDEIQDLFEDIINDPDFDIDNFNPEDFFPEETEIPEFEEE